MKKVKFFALCRDHTGREIVARPVEGYDDGSLYYYRNDRAIPSCRWCAIHPLTGLTIVGKATLRETVRAAQACYTLEMLQRYFNTPLYTEDQMRYRKAVDKYEIMKEVTE